MSNFLSFFCFFLAPLVVCCIFYYKKSKKTKHVHDWGLEKVFHIEIPWELGCDRYRNTVLLRCRECFETHEIKKRGHPEDIVKVMYEKYGKFYIKKKYENNVCKLKLVDKD